MSITRNMHVHPLIILALMACSACSPKVENRGYVNIADAIKTVEIGSFNKEDVLYNLGSPSTISNFGEETWYYVTTKKETTAFFAPDVVTQDVTAISFDGSGLVSNIDTRNIADRKEFELVTRKTPTEGHSLTFIEQIVGNIGRFNKTDSTKVGPKQRGRPTGY